MYNPTNIDLRGKTTVILYLMDPEVGFTSGGFTKDSRINSVSANITANNYVGEDMAVIHNED